MLPRSSPRPLVGRTGRTGLIGLLVALVCSPLLAACGSDDGGSASEGASGGASGGASDAASGPCAYPSNPRVPAARPVSPPPSAPEVDGTVTATVDTSIGTLTFTLDAAGAPCTVNSFVSLAQQGYFDKTTCHRLTEPQTGISVLQCGDPTGTGAGGPGYTVPDELKGNSGDYPAGTLAMANTGQPDSGGSQFFIVYGPTQLGPSYTIFGTVDAAGVQAIEKVASAGTDNANGTGDGAPTTPVDITSVTVG